jgi:hypothetical protein
MGEGWTRRSTNEQATTSFMVASGWTECRRRRRPPKDNGLGVNNEKTSVGGEWMDEARACVCNGCLAGSVGRRMAGVGD